MPAANSGNWWHGSVSSLPLLHLISFDNPGARSAYPQTLSQLITEHDVLRKNRGARLSQYWSLGLVLLLSLLIPPTSAVLIQYQNCLSDDAQNSGILQFRPAYVGAVFNTTDASHNLNVTVWGNVTGSFTTAPLPPYNSPDWTNPNYTDGKIVDIPDPDLASPKITTLSNQINVLTYEPWSDAVDFCDSLINSSCPLGPAFNANEYVRSHPIFHITCEPVKVIRP